ncbi:hypothetical protein [Amphibacillus cookii]|nr:hypothetical protein [Amphibacillus cookii]MBM7543249.1 hypothetical protein [Amphibacillus cookii]
MEIGGLMAEAFKIFLGNPDIMTVLLGWGVFVALILTVLQIYNKTKL